MRGSSFKELFMPYMIPGTALQRSLFTANFLVEPSNYHTTVLVPGRVYTFFEATTSPLPTLYLLKSTPLRRFKTPQHLFLH